MSKAGLAKLAGVDRGKLQRFEDGEDAPSERWIGSVERALENFEEETGDQPRGVVEDEHGGIVRIRLEGVFGATSAVVEAPADNPDALAAALDVLMRRMNEQRDTQ